MNSWRIHLLFYSMAGMIATLFFSRFLLSFFMILFVLISLLHRDIKNQFRNFFSSPLLWAMSLLFMLPFISGLWSGDKEEWFDIAVRKLPLFVLPLAFAARFEFSKKQWHWMIFIFIAFVTGSTLWSMFHYSLDMQAVNESYLKAKTLVTPLENDHVRFSWLVSITALLSGWMWLRTKGLKKFLSWTLLIITTWLIMYLHILAARTGLFSFYIIIFVVICRHIIKQKNFLRGALLLFLLIALPVIAYWSLPSFQNRVRYILYDYSYFKDIRYLPGGTDAVRIISIRAGWNVMNNNPVTGVGSGDVLTATKNWYDKHYPEMLESDKLYPSSEWLIYGSAYGWPGLVIFSIVMIIPFLIKGRYNILWLLLNVTAAASMAFDIGLEVQFGIFIYSLIVLWWWKWQVPQKQDNFEI
jgi:O-antigen ligase